MPRPYKLRIGQPSTVSTNFPLSYDHPPALIATRRQPVRAHGRGFAAQVREHIRRHDWKHAEHTDSGRQMFLDLFRELWRCEHPLHIPPSVAGEPPQLQSLAYPRRPDYYGRSTGCPKEAEKPMRDYCRAVIRNTHNDSRRSVL